MCRCTNSVTYRLGRLVVWRFARRQCPDSQTVDMTRLDKEWAIGEIDAFLVCDGPSCAGYVRLWNHVLRNSAAFIGN
jgi:hypothetical protein